MSTYMGMWRVGVVDFLVYFGVFGSRAYHLPCPSGFINRKLCMEPPHNFLKLRHYSFLSSRDTITTETGRNFTIHSHFLLALSFDLGNVNEAKIPDGRSREETRSQSEIVHSRQHHAPRLTPTRHGGRRRTDAGAASRVPVGAALRRRRRRSGCGNCHLRSLGHAHFPGPCSPVFVLG